MFGRGTTTKKIEEDKPYSHESDDDDGSYSSSSSEEEQGRYDKATEDLQIKARARASRVLDLVEKCSKGKPLVHADHFSSSEEEGSDSNFDGRLDLSLKHDDDDSDGHGSVYTKSTLMMNHDALHDITLKGSDGVKVGVNRAILASKNRVFQRLLLSSFAMNSQGTYRSVKINFKGKVLRSVVEFILTDNTKVLDIRDKAEIRRQAREQKEQQETAAAAANKQRKSMFDFFKSGNASSNRSVRSTASSQRSGMSQAAHYSRPQIEILVSLTRAAVFFKIPALGMQARDTLKHYLQRSPASAFCVLEACRQEPDVDFPKEMTGVALSAVRNFVGTIRADMVEFLSPPVMIEILQDEKLRMDDYQLFQMVQRWANCKDNITIYTNVDDHHTEATAESTKGESDDDNSAIASGKSSSSNHNNSNRNSIGSIGSLMSSSHHTKDNGNSNRRVIKGGPERQQMAIDWFLPLVRLECIDPPILAQHVANSGLISQQQLLHAFQQQALAAHLRAGMAFQRPRTTKARWKKSLSDIFISRYDNEFKEDVLTDYPPISSGIHQWTINVEDSRDFTWLGISISKYYVEDMDSSSSHHSRQEEEQEDDEGDNLQERNWVYSNHGEAFHAGKMVDLRGRMLPPYGTGSQITFTLFLHWKDHGTLIASVDGCTEFVLFTNLRASLHEGEGFLPTVSMHSPGSVRIVDIRHVRQHPFVLDKLSSALGG